MANELVLMERGAEQMFVHPAQVDEYVQSGWKEISHKEVPAELEQVSDKPIPEQELVFHKRADSEIGKKISRKAGKE